MLSVFFLVLVNKSLHFLLRLNFVGLLFEYDLLLYLSFLRSIDGRNDDGVLFMLILIFNGPRSLPLT